MSEAFTHPVTAIINEHWAAQVPAIARKQVLAKTPTGEVRLELGADGLWLLFDGPCLEMLPYCQAQCCALRGTAVRNDEEERLDAYLEWDDIHGYPVMRREADGFCQCLNRESRKCSIYEDRPDTCRKFHCTQGAHQRGWKLPNAVQRQSIS